MDSKEGGPAFPSPDEWTANGMSLRAWLAGQALAGLSSENTKTAYVTSLWNPGNGLTDGAVSQISKGAVQLADAVLAELEKS